MNFRESILGVLNSGTGFGLEFAEMLSIGQLEDLRFFVLVQPDAHKNLCDGEEFIYNTAEEAVDQFLELRAKYSLGYDYERGE